MEVKRGFITVNGKKFPYPSRDNLQMKKTTLVNAGRNVNGKMVGEVIGREQGKIKLFWKSLPADVWAEMCQEFEKFFLTVTYPDMTTNSMVTRSMYCGDRTATPYMINNSDLPTQYINCKCNLIDMGDD